MGKHTAGPWHVRNDREFYNNHPQPLCISNRPQDYDNHDEDETWIARCMDSWDDEMQANARLMAAAPELLSFAIQYLYSEHGECVADDFAAPYTNEQLGEIARAAIRKAKGE